MSRVYTFWYIADMSKASIRNEKKCLNCQAEVPSTYCPECGQKNSDPHLSIKDILHDFLHDLTHFDGKFFLTAKLLITRPGFLSTEFIKGKRATYLHPVRMYVFTSAVFFYFLYSFLVHVPKNAKEEHKEDTPEMIVDRLNELDTGKHEPYSLRNGWLLKNNKDTLMNLKNKDVIDSVSDSISNLEQANYSKVFDPGDSTDHVASLAKYNSIDEYLHDQKKLSPDKRDGIVKRFVSQKIINLILFFKVNKGNAPYILLDTFLHQFSAILFVSLPLVTLILSMLFYKRRDLNYATHGIFLLHLYVFMLINTFVVLSLGKAAEYTGLNFLNTLSFIVGFVPLYYGYKAIKRFYDLKRSKTLVKFSIFLFLNSILFSILFLFYFILTLIKV